MIDAFRSFRDDDGLGSIMFAKAKRQAETSTMAQRIPKFQLLVRSKNNNVTSFYASLGYELVKVIQMQKWPNPDRDRLYCEGV